MKKYLIILGILLLSTSILIMKNEFSSEKSPVEKIKINVRLKWIHQAQFAGFYIAREKGYYDEEGLDVTLNPGGPDISPIQMVLSGTDSFGITGADQILLAREKGIPIVAVAVLYKNSPVALASLKEKNIRNPKDLENKKVAVVYGRDEEVIYRALLEKEKVDRDKIREVPLTFDLSQITTNKVDAQIVYEINEPILLDQKGFSVDLLKPRDYGINVYADTLFTTEDLINKNPDLVRKFVRSSMSGWREAIINPELATDVVLAANNTLNRDHQLRFLQLSIPLIQTDEKIGSSEKSKWEDLQSILINQGFMKAPIDVSQVFTNSFLE